MCMLMFNPCSFNPVTAVVIHCTLSSYNGPIYSIQKSPSNHLYVIGCASDQRFRGWQPSTYKLLLGGFWTWPSAADEKWYSPKRPSSTVANGNSISTEVSHLLLLYIAFPIDKIGFILHSLHPSWDRTAPYSVVPFVGPDGISHHYGGRLLHLYRCRDHTRSSLAKSFLLYYIMLAVHEYDEGYMVHQTLAT